MFDVQEKSWVVETNYHIPENKEPQRKWSKFKAVVFVKKLKSKKLSFILIPRVTRFYASLEVKMTTWPEETRILRTRSWMRRSIRSFKIPQPLSPPSLLPFRVWIFEDWFVQISETPSSPTPAKIVFKCLTQAPIMIVDFFCERQDK